MESPPRPPSVTHSPSVLSSVPNDLALHNDDRIPLHRRSLEIRNDSISFSRSSSASSQGPSRSRSRVRRDSFASVKEDDTEVAQTFTISKVSTIATPQTFDESPQAAKTAVFAAPPDFCCPCGSFRGWKAIQLGGRKLSKSYGDLRLLGNLSNEKGWAWESRHDTSWPIHEMLVEEAKTPKTAPKHQWVPAPIEELPVELLDQIISNLSVDLPPNGYTPRNADLISCLLTSRTLHAATLSVLYRNITIPHSQIFSKALKHITDYPALGTIVRRLDFSHFTSVGLGRTKQMNVEIQNVTAKTLLRCLELVPNLKEFLVQEHLDDDLSELVLRKLFLDMPALRAVDFCACSSRSFRESMSKVLKGSLPDALPLRRISLHECQTLPAEAFEILLPRLPLMTILDCFHTSMTDDALFSIPKQARLTHLNLGKCTQISGSGVVKFLTTHPAVKDSLIYLNLMADISRYRLFQDEDEVSELLQNLPPTLRSLNLSGAKITHKHIPLLQPLAKYLEEISIGFADLSIRDINSLFVPLSSQSDDDQVTPEEMNWVPSTLVYLDVTGVSSVTQAELFGSSSVLTSAFSQPLQVIELDSKIVDSLTQRSKSNKRLGWVTREYGRRGWYVREPVKDPDGMVQDADDGRRSWKMGARYWGMRKVSVAVGEVGGLYGHYMFKK